LTLAPPAGAVLSPSTDVVLLARGIRKTFGGVVALDGVDFVLRRGEIHGLVGQNGAGKSTLVKILNGVHRADAGTIELDGRVTDHASTEEARRAGIAMVFQEFSLIPTLTVAQNVFLAHEPRNGRVLIDAVAAAQATTAILDSLGVSIDPRTETGRLPVGSQQLVEIAKAMSISPSILILDEPTASLSQGEVETLFVVLRRLRSQGVSVVFISHHLQEVMGVCDSITVLRDGHIVLTGPATERRLSDIVAAMTGRRVEAIIRQPRPADAAVGPPALELAGWTLGTRVQNVSWAIAPGEVLGVAGLLGSGRTSLLRSIVGLEPGVQGELRVGGHRVRPRSPADAIEVGIAYVPEDRRREGIVAGQSVQSNLLLGVWDRLVRHFLLNDDEVGRAARDLIGRLAIRTSGPDQLIEHLSGGNQQKVVVGRSLARRPRVLLLDDPTSGIDIGSRRELLGHIRAFADHGGAVVLVSSELEELGAVADRVAILWRGMVVSVLDASSDSLSEASLLEAIQGGGAGADGPTMTSA
jgi:ribose transport system ATP-binding protein